jgi:glycosyltransferase involved in cell wall biosynthesis
MSLGNAAGVARLAALMRRVSWGCRASEPDVWTLSEIEKTDRLADAAFCFAPGHAVAQHLRPFLPGGDRVVLAPAAVDLSRFTPPPDDAESRVGESREFPVRLVSVGRLAESRGYVDLLNALADMPKATHWRLVHIGDGEAASAIRQHALNLGLGPKVVWRGPCDQTEVLAALRDADIYVQTPRPPVSEHQGLPHAVIEAASQRLPVISTRSSASAEFLVADENALVVRSGQVAMLTDAIQRLARDPEERKRLGGNGRLKVEATRSLAPVVDTIAQRLRRAIA